MRPNASKGLGDTINKVTTVTGIKSVVNKVSKTLGMPCGCDKRKEILNNIFPYKNSTPFTMGKTTNK